MLSSAVVRVGCENAECLGKHHAGFLPVTDRQFLEQSIKTGGSANVEGAVHFWARSPDFLRFTGAVISASSALAGRLLPARYSCQPCLMIARTLGSLISRSSSSSSDESFGTMVIDRPLTRNSTRSPGLKPALRRTLLGTVISLLGLSFTAI